jgi:nucleotide-binding universal stress UspA family protein
MLKTILVPIDFTEVTENALKHAIHLSKTLNAGIKLLNIVKSPIEAERSLKMLDTLSAKYADSGVTISSHAEVGEIKDIGKFAEILEAGLVIMGTHGLKGIQYVIGSKALTVISKSKTPFIVTQTAPASATYQEIVVPMDFTSEEKAVLGSIAAFAKTLNARIRIIAAGYKDEILAKKIKLNLSFAQRFLKEKQIAFTINETTGQKDFQEEIMDFAQMIEADLIALINHHEDGYKNLLGNNFDQNIITNKLKIPVFMFTAKHVSDRRDIFMIYS